MTPIGGSHGKPHWTTKILSHARRRGGRVAARRARAARRDAGDRLPRPLVCPQKRPLGCGRRPARPDIAQGQAGDLFIEEWMGAAQSFGVVRAVSWAGSAAPLQLPPVIRTGATGANR